MTNFSHERRRVVRATNGTGLTTGATPCMRKSAEFIYVVATAQEESLLCSNQSSWRRIAGEDHVASAKLDWRNPFRQSSLQPTITSLIVGPSPPPYIASVLLYAKPMIDGGSRPCQTIDDDVTFPQLYIRSFLFIHYSNSHRHLRVSGNKELISLWELKKGIGLIPGLNT